MKSVSSFWHLLGFVGAGLFMSRMWVQWWQSEKAKESVLTPSFWWISLIGASLTLCYAIYI
ncbi:lipid-A-disaccharide synthase N-terminal domain-containing protein, partial [Pseudomonas aeruginosa]|nr:lipid-A-disaccharide synthase N-terminal domain-containing protein [Pseudomonas aeruginosa]